MAYLILIVVSGSNNKKKTFPFLIEMTFLVYYNITSF